MTQSNEKRQCDTLWNGGDSGNKNVHAPTWVTQSPPIAQIQTKVDK